MSVLDVKDLAKDELPKSDFPATKSADFRVHLAPSVHQGIWRHASEKTSVEICGVLVGLWSRDADGPYASITQYIRCDGATQKFAEVTFTHDSWAQINKEMDSKYQDLRIIGWYHSHPNFGIFLSDRDGFIQQNFFSGSGQIAMVVDPVRKIEGIFVWRKSKTTPLTHFWVGDKILLGAGPGTDDEAMSHGAAGDAAAKSGSAAGGAPSNAGAAPGSATAAPRDSLASWSSVLFGITLFLAGWLWAVQLGGWQRAMIEQGAVAHYGVLKLYKPGFEQRMERLSKHQAELQKTLKALNDLPNSADENVAAERKKLLVQLATDLKQEELEAKAMLDTYGLNEQQKQAMAQEIAKSSGAKDHVATPDKPAATPTPSATPTPTATAPTTIPTPLTIPLATPTATPLATAPAATTPVATTPAPTSPAPTSPAPTATPPAPTATPSATLSATPSASAAPK